MAQSPIIAPATSDTIRLIQILKGNSMREKLIDSNSFRTIAGDVQLRESLTLFNCDSAAINNRTNVMEAFGNIHINQNDSIHTYSQYLKYIGQQRIAYLKKNVKLTDKKGTLYTEELEYDLKTNIGTYKNGGRVVNGKTTLTSEEGVYYADTKDVYFKKNVHLVDPKYNIDTDSLLYNTQTQVVTFITQTHIKNKEGGDVYTSSGTYDLKNGKAFFGSRTVFKDSTRTYVADNSAIDEATGIAQLEGRAVIRDSVNGYTILGDQIFLNRKNNSFLATRKPVLIFKGEGNDSTFVAADTLFSGVITKDISGKKKLVQTDTLQKTIVINDSSIITSAGSVTKTPLRDSTKNLSYEKTDSLVKKTDSIIVKADTPPLLDTTMAAMKDTAQLSDNNIADALLKKDTTINLSKDTAIRYFQAFHHVRIYNDSLQAVCDSLFYSSEDSVFRLYQDPLVFSKRSQISGDTIHLYTKNKKADRIYVFDNGIIINELNAEMYNQIGGRTLNGYFKDGGLDYMRVKGSPAESVFYPQDDDSAYTGMNRCKGDVIDIYFIDKAVNKVKFINDVDGTLYPMNQVPDDQKRLARFKWEDARRPKNKLELFE
ncbi:MAG: LPS export ABC transporter periplasmic protein LptC [Chitinophagaceae bacterium]|nr:LPS export ABC transporter periplasmic protein LptC [Chitinophagaceae bacterium]